jgi:hypothetical protein
MMGSLRSFESSRCTTNKHGNTPEDEEGLCVCEEVLESDGVGAGAFGVDVEDWLG